MIKNILVLGGTAFIGRAFCDAVLERTSNQLTLFNRGITNAALFPNAKKLICDRNNEQQCKDVLLGTQWDSVVDFTCQADHHIRNVVPNCIIKHYTFVSTSAVDLSFPSDQLFSVAKDKLWCEHLVSKMVSKALIVRPGFVCGKNDYTNRFEYASGQWFWKGTREPVRPMVTVELLTSLLLRLIADERTGIVKAGYL